MEMLIVVALISITAALAAPALMNAMANRRANEAQHSVVRIGAHGRSAAVAYGRAHTLTFVESSSGTGGDYGTLELWRGISDRCAENDWGTIITASCDTDRSCVESLDMGAYAFPTHRVQLRLMGATAGSICFEPNGEQYFASGGGLWSTTPPAGQDAVQFRVRRESRGTTTGTDRFVIFPFGATPRIDR